MIISYSLDTVKNFSETLLAHNRVSYINRQKKFNKLAQIAIKPEIADACMSYLKPRSHSPLNVSFEAFMGWLKKNFASDLALYFHPYLAPESDKEKKFLLFDMVENRAHPLWAHVDMRFYKVWDTLTLRTQGVYACLRGIEQSRLEWEVLYSRSLQTQGMDFALKTPSAILPICLSGQGLPTAAPVLAALEKLCKYTNQRVLDTFNLETTKGDKNISAGYMLELPNGMTIIQGLSLIEHIKKEVPCLLEPEVSTPINSSGAQSLEVAAKMPISTSQELSDPFSVEALNRANEDIGANTSPIPSACSKKTAFSMRFR